jgi:hypothetical protein
VTAGTPKWHLDRIERDVNLIYEGATYTAQTQGLIRSIWADLAALRRLLDAQR